MSINLNGAPAAPEWGGGTITAGSPSTIPLIIKGATSQTANLLSIQSSSATNLVIVDASGNVGINTTTLGGRYLTVNGNAAIWGSMPLRLGESSNTYYYDQGRDVTTGAFIINGNQSGTAAYIWQSAGTERMRINSAGLVGIGASSPNAPLEIYNSTTGTNAISLFVRGGSGATVNDGGSIAFSTAYASTSTTFNTSASGIRSLNAFAGESNGEQGSLAFYTNNRTGSNTYTGNIERVRIDSAGNVGIGTSTPAAKLDVNGSINATNLFMAGKNKIINGDFSIWQRGTTFTNIGGGNYSADRWVLSNDANPTTQVISQQPFTAGSAPVSGYESSYYLQNSVSSVGSCTFTEIAQKVEDVRTFAGQTVTYSFWAKADSARSGIVYVAQVFGTGGTATNFGSTPSITFSNSWQRYSFTFSMQGLTGKTLGTNSYILPSVRMNVASGAVLQLWGAQLEAGSVATPFTTASGSIQDELAMCQRYYWQNPAGLRNTGSYNSTTTCYATFYLPVTMRTAPTIPTPPTTGSTIYVAGSGFIPSSISVDATTPTSASFAFVTAATTAGYAGYVTLGTATIFSAEL